MRIVCQRVIPSARLPSRRPEGSARSDVSATRSMTGILKTVSASAPRQHGKAHVQPLHEEQQPEQTDDDGRQ